MKLNKVAQFKFAKPINLYCFTDIHIGAVDHDAKLWNKALDKLSKDKDGYCILNGDILEIIPYGYHISQQGQALSPTEQFIELIKLLKKYEKKILFYRFGNHEERIHRLTDVDVGALLNEHKLKITKLGVGMEEVHITIGKRKLRMVSTHGEGGNSKRALTNMKLTFPGADVYFTGHTHELYHNSSTMNIDTSSGTEVFRSQIEVVGGSFLRWAGYAREKNMVPTQPGCFVIRMSEEGAAIKEVIK